jgi:NADPH-dependent glutamate synthase beta subunit-like oxidoreductase
MTVRGIDPDTSARPPIVRGSVLVVGAGIAGMQSALDLANAGYKVYLAEKETSIGGRMAQLDKTFPTNDCAMCTISPRLIDVARHDDIELITGGELQELSGSVGEFSARLHLEPRYVDLEKCNACGECFEVCPVRVPAPFEAETADRPAIHRRYPQAIPSEFAIDKRGTSPCRIQCPAGCNAHAYIALIGQGRFDRAAGVIRETLPLPGVMGRICDHPCEAGCHRDSVDQALAIRNLKRFAADWEAEHAELGDHGLPLLDTDGREQVAAAEKKPQRVAIVGSGPAGLTAARDLVIEGYRVTVFEAQPKAGGMLRYGIPRYRLEEEVLDRDIQSILDLGVELRTGKRVRDPERLLEREGDQEDAGFDAAFVAVGAWKGQRLDIPGEEAAGVWQGLEFLREINSGRTVDLGAEIVVIGGGDVAMDAARCARRLSGVGRVSVVCLEARYEMPAHPWEAQEALEEGVEFLNGWGPTEIRTGDGRAAGVVFRACTSVFDGDGMFAPTFDDGRTMAVEADAVIITIGQAIDTGGLEGLAVGQGGLVAADDITLATNSPGVFAGGDAVLGPATAVQAIAQGHRAAESIMRYLRGDDLERGRRSATVEEAPAPGTTPGRRPRRPMPTIDIERRVTTFDALEYGYDESEAVAEAGRCLNCGGCCECMECVRVCSPQGIDLAMGAGERRLDVGAVILAAGCETFDPAAAGLYLHGEAPNVVTNLQFERMCSSSGPTVWSANPRREFGPPR